ncbi:MAG: 1-acyl-sn-glycerol-3-phosphate acyltransferase [Proteobacteria bacterium]|nr:MAG: 1-acyl-sn-glycerol-3-phosphate acyltransferase [Pseudomonadota bacterium]
MKALREYQPILSKILQRLAKETRFQSTPPLGEILEANPRLVVAFNHSSPLSWLPAISLLTSHVCARGGGGRRPMGVMDKFFFSVPGFRTIAQQLTQSEHALGFEELVEKFKSSEGTDIVIFPEGSNCFFGDPAKLQPFRSPRFIELAVRTGTPILVCAHRGSEDWGVALPIPEKAMHTILGKIDLLPAFAADFLKDRLKETGVFTLPLLPLPMQKFEMRCEVFYPHLKVSDLSKNREECRAQINEEAERVHAKLESLLKAIDQDLALKRSSVSSS